MSNFTIHERLFECEQIRTGNKRIVKSANDYSPDAPVDSPAYSEYVQEEIIVRHPDGRSEREWATDWNDPKTKAWEGNNG